MAAGLGFKDFTTGEVLTAADVDGYLMQGVWVFASATARDAAVTSPQEGNFAYLKDTNVTTYYTGSAWTNLDTTGMTNPMTTTGDMVYSSSGSTPARLGIGSTGNILTVAGGVPTWAAPGGGNFSYDLINTGGTALTGASTITVSGISGKNFLAICVDGASSVNTSSTITLRFNADSNAKYGQAGTYMRDTDSIRGYVVPIDGNVSFDVGQMNANAGSTVTSNMTFTGTAGTGAKLGTILTYVAQAGGSGVFVAPITNCIYTGSSAITSVSLISSSGNFDAGTLYVYGA
jgi:hypothetical protein